MPSLPSATTRLQDESGGLATGSDLCVVLAPVATNDDHISRLFSSAQAIYDFHGYSPGLDFAAIYFQATGKPVMFGGLTIGTPGTVGRFNNSGNTGTSVVSVAAGGDGALDECDGVLKVTTGGTIGTNGIILSLSMDGGRTYVPVRLGTASSYTIPYVGQVLSFAAGTLVAGDTVLTWHSVAPIASGASVTDAKVALAAQTRQARRWLYESTISVAGDLTEIKAAIDAYETTDERYALCKASLRDRLPYAEMSRITVGMTGAPSLTFAEVGATGDTITRSAGSWVTDGFVGGDRVTVTLSASNNIVDALVTTVSDLVLTLDTTDLVDEGPVAGCVVTGSPGIIFAEVGATGDTITRSRGSWLDDGFRTDDNITIAGTASNDGTTTAGIDTVTALVITLDTDDLVAEAIRADLITIEAGETAAAAVAALDTAMVTITSDERLDLGYGRGAMLSPVTGWKLRRPVSWADMILSYQRDFAETTWWKDLGSIDSRIPAGFDLTAPLGFPYAAAGAASQAYEYDARVTAGALAARFTCARTWGNGPAGAFIAQSLTRADDGSLLGMSHNVDVANLAQTVVQATTEKFAGQTLVLNDDGTPTAASLKQFENKVNGQLRRYLLSNVGGYGPRASSAVWTAATDDDLSVADAVLNGSLALVLKGTIVHIATTVKVS